VHTQNQIVELPILKEKKVSLTIKREDLIHPFISGNKFRKLKYNLLEAQKQGFDTILTYGGAFSNHIAATAYAGKIGEFKTVGIIRGEELHDKWHENPTLKLAHEHGMQFHFVARDIYREKENPSEIKKLEAFFGPFYRLPEGGSNVLAVKGCEEILTEDDAYFDVICSAVGTGSTISGIINASHDKQRVLGFPALKGGFLKEDIRKFVHKENWRLQTEYHFGGYAKVTSELIDFTNEFKRKTQIPLDPIYTGKLLFGVLAMVKKDEFQPNTKILAIHTGGLQSITGMNLKLKKKNLPLFQI
jgi:1-aminocyclopropane-1-carboxylate deaminase